MDINSVNGVNAYTGNAQANERTQVENQNRAAAQSDLQQQDVRVAQQAFQVNITQEARQLAQDDQESLQTAQDQQTRDALDAAQTQQPQPPAQNYTPDQTATANQQASQIVNIVA